MYTIKAKPITIENFKPYGTFASMLEPTGPSLGDFYNDQVEFPVSGNIPIAFSPLVVHKGEMLVTMAEYHDTTCEGVLPMDDDVVLHVAPATKEPPGIRRGCLLWQQQFQQEMEATASQINL